MSTPYAQQTPEERRLWKSERNRAHRARKGVPAKQPKTEPTAHAVRTPCATGHRFVAIVRQLDRSRVYLGSYETAEEALQVGAEYLATGTKPRPARRGMKVGQKKRTTKQIATDDAARRSRAYVPPVLLTDHQSAPLSTAERLARNAAKAERQPGAVTRSAPETPQHSAPAVKAPRIASQEPAPMTPEQRAERLEALKAAWRRTA